MSTETNGVLENEGLCLLQAKDPSTALAAFSQFCNTTVNEEEEIAHKLLGEAFQVMEVL